MFKFPKHSFPRDRRQISQLHSLVCGRRKNVKVLVNNSRNECSHPRCFLQVKNEKNGVDKDMEVEMVEKKYLVWRRLLSYKVFVIVYYHVTLHCIWLTTRRPNWHFCQDCKNLCFTASLFFQFVSLVIINLRVSYYIKHIHICMCIQFLKMHWYFPFPPAEVRK